MSEILGTTIRSLYISGSATLISSLWSIPLAYALASSRKSSQIASLLEALVGVPTVLVGLLLYLLLSRQGPLGILGMLYTPQAIILGESILVTPLLTSVAFRVLRYSIETYGELAYTLGSSSRQAMALAVTQSLPGLASAMVMAFSRAIGELGVALLVGGNLRGYTRTLTTAIALEVSKGEFQDAISLGTILVVVMVLISFVLRLLRRLQ
ncbi:MAG: ABC transporter permease [Desulfurococcales archaeon]|nr:ABC transporter permease [Desulfurococcales archaeon]